MDNDLTSAIDLLNDIEVKKLYKPQRYSSVNRKDTETTPNDKPFTLPGDEECKEETPKQFGKVLLNEEQFQEHLHDG